MKTHRHRQTGAEVKEQRAEEAFGTQGDKGIQQQNTSEERKRGWREGGGHRVLTGCMQLCFGPANQEPFP